jgi:hypothetical protein
MAAFTNLSSRVGITDGGSERKVRVVQMRVVQMRRLATIGVSLAGVLAALGLAACGSDESGSNATSGSSLPQGSERVKLDPADFTTRIDNPYWPMTPGSVWVYRETDAEGARMRVEVTVTARTKRVANGVEARVVHDLVTEKGQPVENTYDWYAQDTDGNLWYMGEDTKEYENGKIASTAGSWEAGVDGAQPGIALPADPKPGQSYRQEYYAGEAEDNGEIVSLDEQAEVPAGHYQPALMTRDTTPVEPKVLEFKFYARGVGPVLELTASGGSDRDELVSYQRGNAAS